MIIFFPFMVSLWFLTSCTEQVPADVKCTLPGHSRNPTPVLHCAGGIKQWTTQASPEPRLFFSSGFKASHCTMTVIHRCA